MPQAKAFLFGLRLALVALCICSAVQAGDKLTVPSELLRDLDKPVLAGSGRLRWLGIPVYEASLWTAPQFVPERFGAHAFALEIRYARSISGNLLADTSLKQMQALDTLPAGRYSEWLQALTGTLPDVKPGDRLTGMHLPGKGLRMYFNGQLHKAIDDPLLSQSFFAIWLSPATQEPRLRAQLLGLGN